MFECAHFVHLSGRVQCPVKRDFIHYYFVYFQLVIRTTRHRPLNGVQHLKKDKFWNFSAKLSVYILCSDSTGNTESAIC